jgi:replicative DNA helicase
MESDYQREILGAVLLNPGRLPDARGIVCDDDFTGRSRRIWRALCALEDEGSPLEPGPLHERSGVDHADLAELSMVAPSAANIDWYAERVADAGRRRRLRSLIVDAAARLVEAPGETDVEALSHQLVVDMEAAAERREQTIISARDLARMLADEERQVPTVSTGFPVLDKYHGGGLGLGTLTILAAAPSVGKSQLAVILSTQMRRPDGQPARVLYVSMEMSAQMLSERLVALLGNIPQGAAGALARKVARDSTWAKFGASYADGIERIAGLPIRYYCRGTLGADGLRALVASAHRDIDVVVIDYLQLARRGSGEEKREAIERMSHECKALAARYGLACIAISSLSREGYRDQTERPNLAHLKESGDLEFDADCVWMLWRAKKSPIAEDLELHIRKQRQGPLGTVRFNYHLDRGRIVERPEECQLS